MADQALISIIAFGRNIIGIAFKPYEAYRNITDRSRVSELAIIGCVLSLYFIVASLVKTSLFRPFLLTQQFLLLLTATAMTFFVVVALFWTVGRLFGASGTFRGFMLGWGYSLIPTFTWFFMTSLLYVLIPPPRTTSSAGIWFSMVYLLISAILLSWKVTLSYLALRFGLRLDLAKILLVSLIVLPLIGVYSIGMYRLGIFRVPFL